MSTVDQRPSKFARNAAAAVAFASAYGFHLEGYDQASTGARRRPWSRVQLTKAERRGKSFEEIDALRRERWEVSNGA